MNSKFDTVSIIVPIYNVEQYLPKCLESLINQTYPYIQILAIVDGSPDNSLQIAKEYSHQDERIQCFEKDNGGYGSVLEYGITRIESKYFMICDPDDWLAADAVETLYNYASQRDLDVLIGDRYDVYFDSVNDEPVYRNVAENNKYVSDDVVFTQTDVGKLAFCEVSPHSKIYKTEICKKIKLEHKASYTDFTLFMCALNNSAKAGYIKKVCSYYLCDRPGNTTTDTRVKTIEDNISVWKSTFRQIESKENPYIMLRLFYHIRDIWVQYKKLPDRKIAQEYRDSILELYDYVKQYNQIVSPLIGKEKLHCHQYKLLMNKAHRGMFSDFYAFFKSLTE